MVCDHNLESKVIDLYSLYDLSISRYLAVYSFLSFSFPRKSFGITIEKAPRDARGGNNINLFKFPFHYAIYFSIEVPFNCIWSAMLNIVLCT